MGIFDKLLGRTWQKLMDKGDRLREQGEPGLALQEYRVALAKLDGSEADRAALDERIEAVSKQLRLDHLARAEELASAAQWERAMAALDSALELSRNDDERDVVHKRKGELRAAEARGADVLKTAKLSEDAGASEQNWGAFDVLIGGLDPEVSEHYAELGEHFRAGWLALHDGDATRAVSLLEKARRDHDDDPYVLVELGRAYLASDRLDDAAKLMAMADERAENSVYVKLQRVEVLWALKRYDDAEAVLQAAHDADETNTKVFRAIGEHALRSGDYDPGIEAVELMLADSPNDLGLLRMAGQLHHAKGQLEQAIGFYEAVLKQRWSIDPETHELVFDAISALGAAQIYLEQRRKLDRAIDLFHALRTVSEGPMAAMMHSGIGRAHMLKKRWAEARQAYEQALELLPEEATETRDEVRKRLAAIDAKKLPEDMT